MIATGLDAQQQAQARIMAMMATALGPVATLLDDDTVIEIMVNPDGRVWVERLGDAVCDSGYTLTPAYAENFLRLVASTKGLACHAETPSLSAVLPGSGARLQGFVPPVVAAPAFVIRKQATRAFALAEYVAHGMMTAAQRDVIEQAAQARRNIVIAGGTGSGKTTLANAVLAVMAATGHRIVTLEDTPELQCPAPNVLALYTREGVHDMRQLVADTMRCRPDRIIVGEVRDGAALELCKAWVTGHSGGLATIHSSTVQQALTRLEQLIQEVVVHVPRPLIAEAVDVIVYIERFGTGRRVQQVMAVDGYGPEGYVLRPLAAEQMVEDSQS
jgi:type IV secretion system protein VirB11